MSQVPSVKLNSGYDFPLIGFGTFGGADAPEKVYEAVKVALKAGYKHFDTAYVYRTEGSVAKAIAESGVARENLFLTTKLSNNFHESQHVRPGFERSLQALNTDYIDLYLMHWPISFEFKGYEADDLTRTRTIAKPTHVPVIDTWRAMEQLAKDGVARSIGVSNFTVAMLEDLLSKCEIVPAVNEVEIHPNCPQEELRAYCKSKGITLIAYSPLGNPGYRGATIDAFNDPLILKIAKKYNTTPVQILLNWGVNRGYAVIPKSTTPSRIEANLTYIKMQDKCVEAISELGRKSFCRICDPVALWGEDCDIFNEH
ncbi:Aldo/keto reductase [Backusella circina FSU 941]|nr:Aldo/keto reductase [Backusella circina FSU 941]